MRSWLRFPEKGPTYRVLAFSWLGEPHEEATNARFGLLSRPANRPYRHLNRPRICQECTQESRHYFAFVRH